MTDVAATEPEAAPEMAVAAPPWAAAALAAIVERSAGTLAVEHVVVDPRIEENPRFPGVRVLWRYHLTPDQLARVVGWLPDLEWVHSDYVGVDDLPLALLAERGVMLSNGAGISAGPMAEWIVLAVLAGAKQLPRFVRQSDDATWHVGDLLHEVRGSTVLILGLGAIGTRASELLGALGATVVGATRRPRSDAPPGVTRVVSGDGWRSELGLADFVVCTLPRTAHTDGMLDGDVFAAMKPGAWLINVSRGAVVDDKSLVAALDSGHLGGAVLDAFRQEPLPTDDPLWRRSDVLVLPHVTWSSQHTLDDFTTRFAEQLRRVAGGETPADQVDLLSGY